MYNRLFTKILDSSIWLEPAATRIVWITLIAAMDEDGYAHFSAIENLAARARVSVEDATAAVECFMNPDANSENQNNEGRRVERVPGGFLVLNAPAHRNMLNRTIQREQTRERVQRFRVKQDSIATQGTCACCGSKFEEPYSKYVVLDHDHRTGNFRAFLCQSCNKVVGQIEKGSVCHSDKKQDAISYIRRYTVTSPLPSVTPVSVSESSSDRGMQGGKVSDREIEAIYMAYSRKVAKQSAIKAIRAAVATLSDRLWPGGSKRTPVECAEWLKARVEAFSASPAGKARGFTPYMATWLNAGQYDDDDSEWQRRNGEHEPTPRMPTAAEFLADER